MDKEKNKMITNVSDFLRRIEAEIKENENQIFAYRGEDLIYENPCIPNLFRKTDLNPKNFFEKNLFDSMRQNKLTSEDKYLNNAIDAQHGEFPSRLLDITYNCLIALYFAVTPYYHLSENAHDDQDGRVYVFHFDKLYSPSAKNTNECYEAIINRTEPIISDNLIFGKNHKIIDHCKMNSRIIAQQGAFILFQGDEAAPLPAYLCCGIIISAKYKADIRKELKTLFGIHTGTVYPEIVNLAAELSDKSKRIVSEAFSLKQELDNLLENLGQELEYYFELLISAEGRDRVKILRITEKVLYSYQRDVLQLGRYIQEKYNVAVQDKGKEDYENKEIEEWCIYQRFVKDYQKKIGDFTVEVEKYDIGDLSLECFSVNVMYGGTEDSGKNI